jgi:predicted nucleotide-binding protein (sugar kinase/HSP70/actin superfamily)
MINEDLVKETESAQPLFDLERQNIWLSNNETNRLYSYLRAHYERAITQELKEEEDFKENLMYLWNKLAKKVKRKIAVEPSTEYKQLLALDNINISKANALNLMKYYPILRDFVDDLGITRVENKKTIYSKSASLMEGLGSEARKPYAKYPRRKH